MPTPKDQAMFIAGNWQEKNAAGKCYVKGCKNDTIKTIIYQGVKRKVCNTHKNRHLPMGRTK